MPELRPYQTNGINQLARLASQGKKRLCFQLATGGGKTVCFAGLIQRYLSRQQRGVLILVHRDELLKQARRTLYDWYGIVAEPVVAGLRQLPQASVYVAMCETANNRLAKNANYFGDIGLVVVDECHLGGFRKLLPFFPTALTIGFTATPISASKKEPLKDIYEDIVTGIDIPELIEMGSLCRNITYRVKNVDAASLVVKRGDFDEKQMGAEYSKNKHVVNTVAAYEKFCLGKKTLVFNCTVAHSQLVTTAFEAAGYPVRHLDGSSVDRQQTLSWFKVTPDAILCNVGVLTTGFDEPSVEAVIMNKDTMSLPLWLQCTGRGSRPFPGKTSFTIVDMGTNQRRHGNWNDARDWSYLFHNPDKPGKGDGVAPVRECISCEAIIAASVRLCPYCGHLHELTETYDNAEPEFELVGGAIDVSQLVQDAEGRNPYYALHRLKSDLVARAKRQGVKEMTEPIADKLLATYQEHVQRWCKEVKKRYNQFHKEVPSEWFLDELKRVYGWEPQQMQTA